jgi:two-component system sensor histidine kinase/response regulator
MMTPSPLDILLVDDRAENLVALEQLLERPDRRLIKATSGNDALRLMLKHDFAVVLLDVEMPDMDGYETARLIRSLERTRAVPIIFLTAGDQSDERVVHGYELGAVDYLYKPVRPQILRSKIDVFTDLHRKTEELKSSNAQLERTTASLQDKIADLEFVNRTLSHDLRAPLRSIHGFSQVLAESLHGMLDAEGEDLLGRILRACERMEVILDELFGLLRATAAAAAGFRPVDTGSVLDGVVENLRTDLDRADATVTRGELPEVRASATLLAQVFQNLIANALKYRGERNPEIHVGAARVGNDWQLFVRDNGVGIAPEHRDRVFGLFQRFNAEDDGSGGAGVGLALCKRAVEKHGGRIWVEPSPGGGSSFYFSIPA